MEKIILIGGGGHCKSCIDVIESAGVFSVYGIVDVAEKRGTTVLGYPVIGTDDDYPELIRACSNFLITIGQLRISESREKLFNMLRSMQATFPVIISSRAYVAKTARIGAGTVVMHGAVVNADAVIGENCIINSQALVEHDARIEDHCHISTAAVINGGVTVGRSSFIGSGAVTKQCTAVPPGSFVKALSLYH